MKSYFELSGKIEPGRVHEIFCYILKKNINCRLILKGKYQIEIEILSKKILIAKTNSQELSLGQYLLQNNHIDNEQYLTVRKYSLEKQMKFGRALLELSLIGYKRLWSYIRLHQKMLAYNMFHTNYGDYEMILDFKVSDQKINLNKDLKKFILTGIKSHVSNETIINLMDNKNNFYLLDKKKSEDLRLHPYEKHIIDLTSETNCIKDIIQKSELLKCDTLRIIYILLLFDVVSESKNIVEEDSSFSKRKNNITFSNFEEIIDHYNKKFKLIFKYLSKEIGPVAYSILSKSLEKITEKLPPALNKICLRNDGSVNKDVLIKNIWYFNFNEIVEELIMGFEEVLHSELFMVREHLGPQHEKKVLKWTEN